MRCSGSGASLGTGLVLAAQDWGRGGGGMVREMSQKQEAGRHWNRVRPGVALSVENVV